ncbi:galactonate dehydratase [Actinophytocola gossypii]|uniref:Galactonate dehydratase n=1 Tax=Actinophytocola gossypii TaxID=2812003 RepID=A0ABT2J542_9PSEU|nr:galactonate dehydratase [Actinophytocola gossypii]MCT2582987.1 galactonate dehydratase [Actinophytocola gossypii]
MRITEVETFLVPPRWLFLKLSTDEGVVGWGEPVVEGRAETVRAAVHELSELLVGEDPLRIEDHWQKLYRGGFYRGGPVLSSVLAGYDQALWDIAGKVRGAPVHELLGGPVRDRLRVYTWVGGDEPDAIADAVAAQVAAGFTAVKMNANGRLRAIDTLAAARAVLRRAEEARAALGDDRDLAIDFHGRVSPAMARRLLAMLADVAPMFVEEPVLPEHLHLVGGLVNGSTVPLATGERLYSRWDFRAPLAAGVAVAQPDPSHAGGISEVRRIAALAEVHGATLAPHCPLGPIALAASLQLGFAVPNFLIQEQSLRMHYHRDGDLLDYLVDPSPFDFTDGHAARPLAPGLGVEIDEAAVRRAAELGHAWRNPVWRHDDGGLAEW